MSFPRYSKYKASGVEWLGEVPEGWGVAPFKSVATYNDDALDETTRPNTEILYVDISGVDALDGIKTKEPMLFSAAPSRARRRVKHGDTIVSTVRTYLRAIARVRNPEENLIVSTGFAVVRPRADLSPDYVGYVLSAGYFIEQVIARSTGVSYPAINASELVRIPVAIPPLSEQTAIAEFLDRETAKIDDLVAEQRRLMELLKEKRQAVISHAVTKGLNPHAPMKPSGIEWLGEVPEGWEVRPLKTIALGAGAIFIDGDWIESKDISSAGIRYLTSGNVGEGTYKEQGQGFITDATFKDLDCIEVLPGDVLISRLNLPIGRACIVPNLDNRIITCVDNVIVRPSPLFSRRFCVYLLSSKAHFENMENLGRGATMPRISRSALARVPFAFPPLSEQTAIAEFLDTELAKFDALTAEAQRATEILQERRTALISAAVTGQIDVRQQPRN